MNCCEHHYTCQECGRSVNAEERPSPREPYVCDDCTYLGERIAAELDNERRSA